MNLLEKYLPAYHFSEIHSIVVNAVPEKCYNQTIHFDLSKSWIISLLFKLRGLPASAQPLLTFAQEMKFTLLEENKFKEFILGFWTKKDTGKIELIDDANKFINDDTGCLQKVAWSFSFATLAAGKTKIITETRVQSITKKSRFVFGLYWLFIKPFSALIRMIILKKIKKELEK